MEKCPKLLALEKNILKYRALQIVLLLHQVESLKSFVLGSIRATDKERLPSGTKKLFPKVWAKLVKEDIITEEESKDIQQIIDIRNQIGHSIHSLVLDISARQFIMSKNDVYDYYALERFEKYSDKIAKGMNRRYFLVIGIRELAFEEAERTYKEELCRLRK